ncbi:hypothetical protein ACFL6I_28030, partial [candidate division KSB1 bacterium]
TYTILLSRKNVNNAWESNILTYILVKEMNFIRRILNEQGIKFGETKLLSLNFVKVIFAKTPNGKIEDIS